jgi:hypothetical protein
LTTVELFFSAVKESFEARRQEKKEMYAAHMT